MKTAYQSKNKKKDRKQKREKLTQSFLLYNFLKLSKTEKEKFFDRQVPEVIFRTMKLEGEDITREDVKKILKSKSK